MNPPPTDIHGLMGMISSAVAPVVLISTVAIFYSALTSKHSHLADQVRQATSEFRALTPENPRRMILGSELAIFERRMDALWASTVALSLSLLCFVCTVLFVIWSQRTVSIGRFGIVSLILGLICLVAAVIIETWEIILARSSLSEEVRDVNAAYRAERFGTKSG